MSARSGGRYTVSKGGTPTLVERTGYKHEAEAKTAKSATQSSGKAARKQEQTDESTD